MTKPKKNKTLKELKDLIDAYFKACEEDSRNLTFTGLILALDMTHETFVEYLKDKKYSEVLKKAKLRVENAYENRLITRGNSGDVFALKNFGWGEKTDPTSNTNDDTREAYLKGLNEKNKEY